ncbi:MAG: AraC family transcriptional regulator [Pseudomonadota bacterium]
MTTMDISRADMVAWMAGPGAADITKVHQGHWRRLDTAVADQGSTAFKGSLTDFHLLEVCRSGRHQMKIESEMEAGDRARSAIVPGSVNFAQCASPLELEVEGTAQLQQVYIADSIFRDVARGIAPGDPDNLRPLGFQGLFEPRVKALAEQILDEARRPSGGGDLLADLLGQQIALTILRRRLGQPERAPNIHALSDAELARVIDHIEAHLEDVGGMDTLAAAVGTDVFAFTRAFKARTGTSPHQFVIQRRLTRVKDLLTHAHEPLAEIAYVTGFSSQSHMTATFSKHFGMSPGAYRKTSRA